jgi:hypothetical protein
MRLLGIYLRAALQRRSNPALNTFLHKSSVIGWVAYKFSGCSKLTEHAKTVLSSDLAA